MRNVASTVWREPRLAGSITTPVMGPTAFHRRRRARPFVQIGPGLAGERRSSGTGEFRQPRSRSARPSPPSQETRDRLGHAAADSPRARLARSRKELLMLWPTDGSHWRGHHAGTGASAGEAGSPHPHTPEIRVPPLQRGSPCGSTSPASDSSRHRRAGPARFLESYSGYLHADAYTGYDAMFVDVASGVIEVACWARAPTRSVCLRRKFFDAVAGNPREAHQMLEWIRQL